MKQELRFRINTGDEYLDGFSIYTNPNGYLHLVTFGMTELYSDAEAFGCEYSR